MKKEEQDLEEYWKVVWTRLPMILLVSLAATLTAWGVARRITPTYEVHFSYLVALSAREEANEFRFDGYYGLQATDLFTATLARWVTTPEVVVAAHREAGLELQSEDPRALARSVRAEKAAPQLVAVTVRGSEGAYAERLAAGLKQVMEKNVKEYHVQGVPAAVFTVVATEPWTGHTRISVSVVVVATFVAAFLIMLNGVLLLGSLKRK